MLRHFALSLVLPIALLTLACGKSDDTSDDIASGSETTASETTASDTTESDTTGSDTTGSMNCNPGRSAGCCFGDGECCPCVQGCDGETGVDQDPATDALIACVCAAEACLEVCANECAGNGIGDDCEPCVLQVGMDVCMAEYVACQP